MANFPNPFWSDAVQQEFRRAQQVVQEDPGERGAAIREGDESEREPPYELGPHAQETPEAGAGDAVPQESVPQPAEELRSINPAQQQEPEAQVARDASPGHYSVTGLSEFSAMERGTMKGLEALGLREVDDRELVPDYSAPPAETQSGSRDPFGDLASMLRVLMQGQQSLVERMDKLESSKASSSSACASSSVPEPRPKAVFPPQFVGIPAVTGKPADLGEAGTGSGGRGGQMGPPTEAQAQAPSAGVVDRALDEWFGDKLYPARGSHAAGRELLERCAEDKAKLDDEADAENRPIKMVELVFVEPLDSKGPNEVAHATARICAQLEVLKLPIARIHTDAGSEFISTPFRRFVDARGILHTAAAPQEHNSNGRVENVVRRLKQQVRTILLANAHPPDKWACAARAVAARWRSDTLARLGWPQPTLAPYGAKTQILTRTWHRRRQSEWKARAEDGIALCPASLVKHGYVVLVGDMLKLATKLFHGDSPNLQVVATNPDGNDPPFEEGELPGPVRRHSAKRPVVLAKVGCERRGTPQAVDQCARELAATAPFDVDAALAFVAQLSLSDLDASRDNGKRLHSGKHHVFGQFVHGGVSGVTKNTKRYSGVAALLTKLVRHAVPHAEFTTVVLSTDAEAVLHRDVHNHPLYPNHIVTVQAPSSGGGLWVQTVSGDEQSGPAVCKTLPTGQVAQGQVFPLGQPFQFNSHRWHCTEPWPCGEHRVVLSAYTVSRPDKLKGAERAELTSLGFNVPPQEQFSNVAVAQQGGATPLKELENPKNLKNSIIQNPKKLESEG